jgi:hypothetical protein
MMVAHCGRLIGLSMTNVSARRHALAAEAAARSAAAHSRTDFAAAQLASAVAELSRAVYDLASSMNMDKFGAPPPRN